MESRTGSPGPESPGHRMVRGPERNSPGRPLAVAVQESGEGSEEGAGLRVDPNPELLRDAREVVEDADERGRTALRMIRMLIATSCRRPLCSSSSPCGGPAAGGEGVRVWPAGVRSMPAARRDLTFWPTGRHFPSRPSAAESLTDSQRIAGNLAMVGMLSVPQVTMEGDMPATEKELINRAKGTYRARSKRASRATGVAWPIIREDGWEVEETDGGEVHVTARCYGVMSYDEVARWRWTGRRLVPLRPSGEVFL